MRKYEIVFRDEVEAESIHEVYDNFLEYLADCVRCGDVSSFQFYSLPDKVKTDPNYWDCDCPDDLVHIHSKKFPICSLCGSHHDDCPDSRVNEVIEAKKRGLINE